MVGSLIRLMPAYATTFDGFGYGALTTVSECRVTEELNGSYTATLRCHMSDPLFDKLEVRNILVIKPNKYDPSQAFRIARLSKDIQGNVDIEAWHLSYDLAGYPMNELVEGDALTPAGIMNHMSEFCIYKDLPFTFDTSNAPESGADEWITYPQVTNIRNLLMGESGLQSQFGGEFMFNNFNVTYTKNRGANRGFTVRYGKNMVDFSQEMAINNMYTGLLPYYNTEEDSWSKSERIYLANNEYDRSTKTYSVNPVMFIDGTYTIVKRTQKGFYFSDATYPFKEKYGFVKILEVDLTDYMLENETLYTAANRYIKEYGLGSPQVSLDVNFTLLSNSPEYYNLAQVEEIQIGDLISVYFEKMGVISQARCVRLEYDVLTDTYSSMHLGDQYITLTNILGGDTRYN